MSDPERKPPLIDHEEPESQFGRLFLANRLIEFDLHQLSEIPAGSLTRKEAMGLEIERRLGVLQEAVEAIIGFSKLPSYIVASSDPEIKKHGLSWIYLPGESFGERMKAAEVIKGQTKWIPIRETIKPGDPKWKISSVVVGRVANGLLERLPTEMRGKL